MTRARAHHDEQPSYRYTFTGTAPTVFPDLTAAGVGELDPGADVEVPVLVVHAFLEPADKATAAAVGELVEWADALAAEASGAEISDVDDDQVVDVADEPEPDVDEAGNADTAITEEN